MKICHEQRASKLKILKPYFGQQFCFLKFKIIYQNYSRYKSCELLKKWTHAFGLRGKEDYWMNWFNLCIVESNVKLINYMEFLFDNDL